MMDTETMVLKTKCPICQKTNEITVLKSAYEAWKNGARIQDAFRGLPAPQREVIKTGICPVCWGRLFDGGEQ